jgi:CelD/BcsL family acetyltransferase involved in cellulose biosynthesis/SAM-dependent methyltransferase
MRDPVEAVRDRTGRADEWAFAVVRDEQGLRELAADWEDLYTRCRRATPYQAHGWVLAHRQAYGRAGRPHVVLVRDAGGRLVALAPLTVVRRCGLRTLQPLAAEVSAYVDVLVDDAEPGAGQALAEALAATSGWSLADLSGVRPGAAAWELVTHWTGATHLLVGAYVTEMDVQPLEEVVAALHGSARRHRGHRLRQVQRLGFEVRQRDAAPGEQVGMLLDLHRELWRGRAANPEYRSSRYRQFLTSAADAMVPRGQAAVSEYRLDDSVVAVDLQLTGHDVLVAHLYGCAPWLRHKMDLTTLFLRQALADAHRTGRGTLSFGRGINGQMVQNWDLTVRRSSRIVLAAPRRSGRTRAYALAVRARRAAADLARQRAGRLTPVHRALVAARTGAGVWLRRRRPGPGARRAGRSEHLPAVARSLLDGALPMALRSLRERGIRATVRSVRTKTADFVFDARRGVHTVGRVHADQLDLVGVHGSNGYMSLNAKAAAGALRALRVPTTRGFVDVGCGRGRMLIVAMEHGFQRVRGIELSAALCAEAERNLAAYAVRHPGPSVQVLNRDATRWPVDDTDSVFYLYNPFGAEALSAVLGNIRASLTRTPRDLRVLYAEPVHRQLLDADPFWSRVGEVPLGTTTVVMYRPAGATSAPPRLKRPLPRVLPRLPASRR